MTERESLATSVIRQLKRENRRLVKCFIGSLAINLFLVGALAAVILQ